jgi:hypothetical protein
LNFLTNFVSRVRFLLTVQIEHLLHRQTENGHREIHGSCPGKNPGRIFNWNARPTCRLQATSGESIVLLPALLGRNDRKKRVNRPPARQNLSQINPSGFPKPRKRSFDPNAFAINSVRPNPSIDSAAVVPDLQSLSLPSLHQMEVLVAIDLAKHDVAHCHLVGANRHNRAKLARIYFARHRIPARAELNRFALI